MANIAFSIDEMEWKMPNVCWSVMGALNASRCA